MVHVQQSYLRGQAVWVRTSQPGETGLGPHTPSTCAGMCNKLLLLLSSLGGGGGVRPVGPGRQGHQTERRQS